MSRNTTGETSAERFSIHLETAPFSPFERDVLVASDHWLKGWPVTFPVPSSFGPVFGDFEERESQSIAIAGQCSLRILILAYTQEAKPLSTYDQAVLDDAILIYTLEIQRILGGLFSLDHDFWGRLHQRIGGLYSSRTILTGDRSTDRHGVLLIPFDAMYYLTGSKSQLEYELLTQSVRAFTSSVFDKQEDAARKRDLMLALRLLNRLDLEDFDAWILSFSQFKAHQS